MESKVRIIIADDQTLFAHLLKTVLETRADEFAVIGIAPNGRIALDMVADLKPDVLLLDLSMPELDGVQTARELVRRKDPVRIMVLTTFDEPGPIRDVLAIGVGGYILKDCEPQELFASILAVHSGNTSLSPLVIKQLVSGTQNIAPVHHYEGPLMTGDQIGSLLNRREQEILALIADGLENKEIATKLFLAEQTIKNNICNMYEKLEVHDRCKLVKLAENFREAKAAKKVQMQASPGQ